jgi:AcrR family transcriptional regulator
MRKLISVTETVPRTQLTRDAIIRTAVELIERDGEAAISMRRIAGELRYGVMSLYNHVPSKEALLDAVSEHVMDGFDFSPDPAADWTDQTRALVRSFRALARRYPRCLNVVISRQMNSTAGLQPLEAALATARSAGFDGETSIRIMRTFVAYALGGLLNEARLDAYHPDPSDKGGRVDPDRFPNIAELSWSLTHADHDRDFEFGLELLINAVSALPR